MEEHIIEDQCNESQAEKMCKSAPEPFIKLWTLDYTNTDDASYKGIAVVSAYDVREAINIFKTRCMHNGYQKKIKIGKIDQVPYPVVPELIVESYFKVFK